MHPTAPCVPPATPAPAPSVAPIAGIRRVLTCLLLVAATVLALSAATGPTAAAKARHTSYIVLVPGDHGRNVVSLQRFLHVRPASGYYGPRTRHAVVRWQAVHHRHRTGLVGRLLWRAVQGAGRAPAPSRSGERSGGLNWAALARCESGGNPRAVNPAGYYGLYQFSPGTWRSVGGSGLPSRASSAEQTHRASILYGRTGARSWPSCGHHLFD
jgi:peptidoglycan hydrolase-like protein with peptidoglycan-binding domain